MNSDNDINIYQTDENENLNQAFEETLDTVEKDYFPLNFVMDYMMEQYNLPSHYFLSSVFSSNKRSQQIQVIINALERFKSIELMREAKESPSRAVDVEVVDVELPPLDEKTLTEFYEVKLTDYSIDALVKRIIQDGIGDWCVMQEVEDIGERKITLNQPLLHITDIHTNQEYVLTKQKLMETINDIWVDFPWAINFNFNSDLDVMLLTEQDMDEIVQVVCLGDLIYSYPW